VAGLFKMFEDVDAESLINPRTQSPALMRIKPRAAFRPRAIDPRRRRSGQAFVGGSAITSAAAGFFAPTFAARDTAAAGRHHRRVTVKAR
jgi:hypothetical protein